MIPPRGIRNVPDRIRERFLHLTSDRGVDLNLTLEHSLRPQRLRDASGCPLVAAPDRLGSLR